MIKLPATCNGFIALYLFKKVLTSKPCWGITINCELQAISFHYFSFSFGKLAPKLVKLGALVEIVNLITSNLFEQRMLVL